MGEVDEQTALKILLLTLEKMLPRIKVLEGESRRLFVLPKLCISDTHIDERNFMSLADLSGM